MDQRVLLNTPPFLLRGPAVQWASACAVSAPRATQLPPLPPTAVPLAVSWKSLVPPVLPLHGARTALGSPLGAGNAPSVFLQVSGSAVTVEASRSSTAWVPPAPVSRLSDSGRSGNFMGHRRGLQNVCSPAFSCF